MAQFMLDSSFCIDLMRDKTQTLRERFRDRWDDLTTSTIVVHELLFGAEKSTQPDRSRLKVEQFVTRLKVFEFDEAAAIHAAHIRADLTKRGCQIGAYDVLIAGHARSLNLAVVTGNLREFTRVEGLRCEDWL